MQCSHDNCAVWRLGRMCGNFWGSNLINRSIHQRLITSVGRRSGAVGRCRWLESYLQFKSVLWIWNTHFSVDATVKHPPTACDVGSHAWCQHVVSLVAPPDFSFLFNTWIKAENALFVNITHISYNGSIFLPKNSHQIYGKLDNSHKYHLLGNTVV